MATRRASTVLRNRDAKEAEVRRRPIAGEYVADPRLPFGRMEFRSLPPARNPQEETAQMRDRVVELVGRIVDRIVPKRADLSEGDGT